MSNGEANWLETLPGMTTLPTEILPDTDTGGLPSLEGHAAPRSSSASRSGCMGRFFRLESPVSCDVPPARAEMAVAIRNVVPEFAASIYPGRIVPGSTFSVESSQKMVLPIFLHAAIVAWVSADSNAFSIVEGPSASDARNTARCV